MDAKIKRILNAVAVIVLVGLVIADIRDFKFS